MVVQSFEEATAPMQYVVSVFSKGLGNDILTFNAAGALSIPKVGFDSINKRDRGR